MVDGKKTTKKNASSSSSSSLAINLRPSTINLEG